MPTARRRAVRRPSVVKRMKTNDVSRGGFLMDSIDNDESISSAGELERFFDSMGLDDQQQQQQQQAASSRRSLQIQVSDDGMESEEEEDFESVSIVGCSNGKGTDFIAAVETDDDEPEVDDSITALSGNWLIN